MLLLFGFAETLTSNNMPTFWQLVAIIGALLLGMVILGSIAIIYLKLAVQSELITLEKGLSSRIEEKMAASELRTVVITDLARRITKLESEKTCQRKTAE